MVPVRALRLVSWLSLASAHDRVTRIASISRAFSGMISRIVLLTALTSLRDVRIGNFRSLYLGLGALERVRPNCVR